MAIPEQQLATWATSVATKSAQEAHQAVRDALAKHIWPVGMPHEEYLQGSYANSTNIRADSDVDLVAQTSGVFYTNILQINWRPYGINLGSFHFSDFRAHVVTALQDQFGKERVDTTGNECIKVAPTSHRLPIDVVPAVEYRHYREPRDLTTGMTFWSQRTRRQIVNYPKLHRQHGQSKNQAAHEAFKPTVRIFKNARIRLPLDEVVIKSRFPSYFVECLIYNAPNSLFVSSHAETVLSILQWCVGCRDSGGLAQLLTQSHQRLLFGDSDEQWALADGELFIAQMVDLWNNWG